MAQYLIRPVKLHRWFPARDPLAASMARLCMLREDHFLELRGIVADEYSEIDASFPAWRMLYFFRRSTRTLQEIRGAVLTLRRTPEFQQLWEKSPVQEQERIDALAKKLDADYAFIKELSGKVGGHLQQTRIQQCLDGTDLTWEGRIQIGERAKDVVYQFSGELFLSMLMPEVAEDKRLAAFKKILERISNQMSAIELVDLLFNAYYRDRRLNEPNY